MCVIGTTSGDWCVSECHMLYNVDVLNESLDRATHTIICTTEYSLRQLIKLYQFHGIGGPFLAADEPQVVLKIYTNSMMGMSEGGGPPPSGYYCGSVLLRVVQFYYIIYYTVGQCREFI